MNLFFKLSRQVICLWVFVFTSYLQALQSNSESILSCEVDVGEEVGLQIISLEPKANYSKTSDSNEKSQLNDGIALPGLMWATKKAVGWVQAPSIRIDIVLDRHECVRKADLGIHLSTRSKHGLSPPGMINVYAKSTQGWYQVGGWSGSFNHGLTESQWVFISLSSVEEKLKVIIHPKGKVTVIDEINLIRKHEKNNKENLFKGYISNPLEHSFSSLVTKKKPTESDYQSGVLIKRVNYLDKDIDWGGTFLLRESLDYRLPIFGDETEIISFGINNNLPDKVCIGKENTGISEWYRLEKVASFLGNEVYDPLLKVEEGFCISPKSKQIFVVKIDGEGVENSGKYSLGTIGGYNEIIANIEKHELEGATLGCFDINPWGYSKDHLVWGNTRNSKNNFKNYLKKQGVTYFFFHPTQFPNFTSDGGKIRSNDKALKSASQLYHGEKVILYAGLFSRLSKVEELRPKIERLISELDRSMKHEGFTYEDWLFYPVDEARGDRLVFLLEVARLVKEINPKIRIYANPISNASSSAEKKTLAQLKPLVDVWQPNYEFISSVPKSLYVSNNAKLWMYSNPKYPAKEESPRFYYELASLAKKQGADGVGFWSLSAASGQTVWNDFDGKVPDWGVFYDMDSGKVIPSRRWEAFVQGMEQQCIVKKLRLAPNTGEAVRIVQERGYETNH